MLRNVWTLDLLAGTLDPNCVTLSQPVNILEFYLSPLTLMSSSNVLTVSECCMVWSCRFSSVLLMDYWPSDTRGKW